MLSKVQRLARTSRGSTTAVCLRALSSGPAVPPRSPYNIDPNSANKTEEEMRVHNRTGAESEYKLGKHRSNALELVNQQPVVMVDGERAICDGGAGPLGHPLEYISLARPGVVAKCPYCGIRYGSKSWH
eukprot:Nitzschia sp. Nitz4//scaffold23_size168460//119875//120261//NITZ4_002236-RA/size168460-processed-gene-0.269-mRNA-1//-1//CDS//3329543686//704//frame0